MTDTIYGIVISTFIAFNFFHEINPDTDKIIKRLRWIMIITMVLDFINTLISQPHSYWLHPNTVHEGNAISYFFLSKSRYYFAAYDLVYFQEYFYWFHIFLKG